ncbi:MAG: hypothetical protein BGO55_25750 [Sphingobacteriales bacterium 50-39]|nr:TonB-dependent receptor [Sphingobacteriales bacterium]OJW56309.1 MAG: hypothetical protein BGO55_25750 [Sphingobacteriales bacterium 50-39]
MSQNFLKLFTFSILWLLLGIEAIAQDRLLKGVIRDAEGKPIAGATVQVKGSAKGVSSAADGSYTLSVPPGDATLTVSYVGYATATIPIKGRTSIDVQLEETRTQLSDVMVVGYGTQKKSDVTGAISSIKNKDFKDQPVSNVAAGIEGKLSGINVTQPSGTPGAGLLVSIRGAQNPLYVVDGVPMLSESNSSLATSYNTTGEVVGAGQNISSISDINPNDIESIEVLKDASSAAIYGARAANGVVLITTKRGKAGKTRLDFNYYTGFQQVAKKIKFLSSRQFVDLTKEAIANDIAVYKRESAAAGTDTSRFGPLSVLQSVGIVDSAGNAIANPLPYDASSGIDTRWLDQIFRTAPVNNYELSAKGGNEKTKFFISGGYFDQSGIIIENYFRRFNVRVNLDHQATDKLSFGTSVMAAYSDDKRSFNDNTYTGIVTNALGASPLMPVYEKDGKYADFTQYQASWLSDNPVKSAKEINAHTFTNRFIGSVYGEYKFLPSLKFRSSWSVDYNDVYDNQYFSSLTVDAETIGGKILNGENKGLVWLNENILTWQQGFGAHHITALAGFTRQEGNNQLTYIAGQGVPLTGGLQNTSAAAIINSAVKTSSTYYFNSWLGRVNYDYDGKYLLAVSVRADGSSRFPGSQQYGYFPAVSAGWNMAKESFLSGSHWINSLKLRMSYGVAGDAEIGNYQNTSYWRPSRYNGLAGLSPLNIYDPSISLTWQKNSTFNTGVDFDIFHHILSGSIEYFNAKRTKLLDQKPIAGTTGFSNITTNSGEIEDKGWEFQLLSNNVQHEDFSWTTAFNISFLKNTIKALAVDSQFISSYNDQAPTHILKTGQPVGTFIGVPFAGVDPQTGDALYYSAKGVRERADEVNFSQDVRIIGNARPKFFGGLTNDFRYKRIDLAIAMQFSYGNKVFNLIRNTYESLGWSGASLPGSSSLSQVYANNDTRVAGRWRKPGDHTSIPRASFLLQNYFPNSDEFLEDGSFLKIRTVNIGYTFPKMRYFNSIRIYAQVQNLVTFTKYIGFDPEVSSTGGSNDKTAGVDYAAYPPARTFTFGASISL